MTNSLKKLAVSGVLIYLPFAWIFYFYFQLGDDTYIYLQYVKNFLANGELAFNSGIPSYGFTAPLWFFMMSFMVMITGQPLASPALLSIAFGLASVILWAKIIMSMTADNRKKILFLLLVALDPNLLKHAWMGMEATGSFFFSSLLIYYIFIRKKNIHPVLFGLLAGLFFFVRPESVLISGVMMVYLIHTKKFTFRGITVSGITASAIVIPWLLFSYGYFGILFPSTFDAKGGAYSPGVLLIKHLTDTAKIAGGNYFIHLALLFFVIVRAKSADYQKSSYYSIAAILLTLGFYFFAINAEIIYARYFCLFIPFGLYIVFTMINQASLRFGYPVLTAVVLLLAGLSLLFSSLHRSSYLSIEAAEDTLIEWVKKEIPANAKIVRTRIGKIGYLTDNAIVDPVGLINKDIIPFNVNGTQADYYKLVRPEYFILPNDAYLRDMKIENVTLVKEFTHKLFPMVRDAFSENEETRKISVYRVNW